MYGVGWLVGWLVYLPIRSLARRWPDGRALTWSHADPDWCLLRWLQQAESQYACSMHYLHVALETFVFVQIFFYM